MRLLSTVSTFLLLIASGCHHRAPSRTVVRVSPGQAQISHDDGGGGGVMVSGEIDGDHRHSGAQGGAVSATPAGAVNPNRRTDEHGGSTGVSATPAGAVNPHRRTDEHGGSTGVAASPPHAHGSSSGSATAGGVGVRGGTSGGATAGGATAGGTTVRGGSRGATAGSASARGGSVHAADGRPVRAQPTARTDQRGAAATPAPGVTVRTDQRGVAATPAPGVTARTDQRGAAATPAPGPLRCSLSTPRAPRGGAVTITGLGFRRPSVYIGGQLARISRGSATSLIVAAPQQPGGGDVRVTDSGRTASCGRIEIR